MNKKFEEWKLAFHTVTFVYNFGGNYLKIHSVRHVIKINKNAVRNVDIFKYLGSVVQVNGDSKEDMMNSIKFRWMKLREPSGILCDKRRPIRLKCIFHKIV